MFENEELYINCDGLKVHAKIEFPKDQKDKMPVLVLIPGFTGHIEEDHIIGVSGAATEAGYVCLRAELYGHGKSDGDFYDHTLYLWLQEAIRVINYAAELPYAEKVLLAGHSQGGLLSVLAAGVMADKLSALLPLAPALNIPADATKGNILGVTFDNDNIPEFIQSDEWKLSSNYIRVARMLPLESAINNFKKPVLIVHGTEDEAVPYEYGKDLSTKYKNAQLISIEGDNHCYNYHLDEVKAAVKTFLIEQKKNS